jgi:hypothetical protein
MATATLRHRTTVNRKRVAIVGFVLALVASYGFLAIFSQPLGGGGREGFTRAAGQTLVADPGLNLGPILDGPAPIFVSYVDGGLATLVKSVSNDGPVALTITGVETSGPDKAGGLALVTVKEAQAGMAVDPGSCCEINDPATWAASSHDFRPIHVDPGRQGVIAVHLLMSNCEDTGAGGFLIFDSIKVDYTVLGFPHVQAIGVGPYWFQSPDTCPRSGPARPA